MCVHVACTVSAVSSPPLLSSVATGHSLSPLFMEQMVCATEGEGIRKTSEKGREGEQIGAIMEDNIKESEGVVRSDREEKDSKRADKPTNGRNSQNTNGEAQASGIQGPANQSRGIRLLLGTMATSFLRWCQL